MSVRMPRPSQETMAASRTPRPSSEETMDESTKICQTIKNDSSSLMDVAFASAPLTEDVLDPSEMGERDEQGQTIDGDASRKDVVNEPLTQDVDAASKSLMQTLVESNANLVSTITFLTSEIQLLKSKTTPNSSRDASVRSGNRFSRRLRVSKEHIEEDDSFGEGENAETDETMAPEFQSASMDLKRVPEEPSQPDLEGGAVDEAETIEHLALANGTESFRRQATQNFAFLAKPAETFSGHASLGAGGKRGWPWLRSILISGMLGFFGIGGPALIHYPIADENDYTMSEWGASTGGLELCPNTLPPTALPHPLASSHITLESRCPSCPPPMLPTVLGSFGASAVLLYGAPYSPLAQPRNVFLGHLLCALVGVATYKMCGDQVLESNWLAAPLCVALGIMAMQAFDCLHPPGGGTVIIAGMRALWLCAPPPPHAASPTFSCACNLCSCRAVAAAMHAHRCVGGPTF